MEDATRRINEHAIDTLDVVSQMIGFRSKNARKLSPITPERKYIADHGEISTLIAAGTGN